MAQFSYSEFNSGDFLVGSSGSSQSAGQVLGSNLNVSGGVSSVSYSLGSNAASGLISGSSLVSGVVSGSVSGGSVSVVSGGSLESSAYSAVEAAILRANNPLEFKESENLTVIGQSGLWVNREEVLNWRGVIPIAQYLINEDSNPEIIRKKTEQQLVYEQEVAIRYLRPPTPPPPGEIVIKQEKNIPTPPAPPLVIRQQPPRPDTPAPLVIREAPPKAPLPVGPKVITISGKRLPPAPRKVVIERLAPLPSKPQAYMVERWLPYGEQKRRVIFQKNTVADPVVQKPRNVVIQWEAPQVQIKKLFKDLGVIRANPVEYVEKYGASLKQHVDFPDFVREIRPPVGVVLAAEYKAASLIDLEGDVQALNLIDLDREGLGEYRAWLQKWLQSSGASASASAQVVVSSSSSARAAPFQVSIEAILNAVLAELFKNVDQNADSRISISEAESVVLKLNSRLGRQFSSEDAQAFFKSLDSNRDGAVNFIEFKAGLIGQFTGN
jgi:hypothetical protein